MVCVGGGRGERFGGDKLAADLGGRPVLAVTLAALRAACPSARLVAVLPADRLETWRRRLVGEPPGLELVAGGLRRQDSVRAGVEAAATAGAEVVAVHDAARPLVAAADVRRTVAGLAGADGAVLCGVVHDTVKRVAPDGRVVATIERDALRLAQTPQVVWVAALRRAWEVLDPDVELTDEAAMLEAAGLLVRAVDASSPNPKLTTADDLAVIRALLEADP
jgi:2-C-methyl-D-erythritol 4-phosphate cytidylyltransferase/2-C-methyl-D-erythritol 2,4-cyclodiphosphate synthase